MAVMRHPRHSVIACQAEISVEKALTNISILTITRMAKKQFVQ